jgi:hypothetical protein
MTLSIQETICILVMQLFGWLGSQMKIFQEIELLKILHQISRFFFSTEFKQNNYKYEFYFFILEFSLISYVKIQLRFNLLTTC